MDLFAIPEIEGFFHVLESRYVAIRPCAGLSLTGITIVSLMEKLIWLQKLNCHGLIFLESFIQKIKQTTSQSFPIISDWIKKIGLKNASLEEFQGTIVSTEFLTEINDLCTNFGLEATQTIKENNIDFLYLSKELNITIWVYDVKSHFEIKNNPFNNPILLTLMQIEKPDGLEVSILYHESQGLDTSPQTIELPYAMPIEDGKGDQSNLIDNNGNSQVLKSFIKKIISYMQDNAMISEESCERINRELQMLKTCKKWKWEFEDDLKKLIEKSIKNPEISQKIIQNEPEKALNELPKADFIDSVEKVPKKDIEIEPERNKNRTGVKNKEFVEPAKKEIPKSNINKPEVEKVPEIPKKKDVERKPENTEIRNREFVEPIRNEKPNYEYKNFVQLAEPAINQQVARKSAICSFCQVESALNAISLVCNCELCISCLRCGASYSRCPSCQRELSDSELDSIFAFIISIS
ncbi:unnamed protein product [Blepharisma stoltei]|uniref:RING-type domain-containing protein n=1 Tax=Blepharisma stoltei TaxID=1481888 RepID=A0AAU9IU32_9CILI|nr:unnamed protein product [Blepharisma stoltei]